MRPIYENPMRSKDRAKGHRRMVKWACEVVVRSEGRREREECLADPSTVFRRARCLQLGLAQGNLRKQAGCGHGIRV